MASLAVAIAAAKHIGEPLQLQAFGRSALLLEACMHPFGGWRRHNKVS